ncbi:MAG: glycosyltransferase family 2 protein [Planctomycetaceae bacterium]
MKPESHTAARSGAVPVTVMILTKDEATNIGGCVAQLEWCDDVVIVDSGSSDDTVRCALDVRSDIRVYEHPFRDFGDQRNWALDNCAPRHEWVLFLDADERCDAACVAGIAEAIAGNSENVGYFLTCRNIFLNRWIKHCTFYPTWQLRLLRFGEVQYRREGHGQREVTSGPLGYIQEPYDHYGFSKGVAEWISRHNRYSTTELELISRLLDEPLQFGDLFRRDAIVRRRCMKRLAARVGFRPITRFIYTYFIRRGFLDGWPGFYFCLLRVAHEIHITVKLAELRDSRTSSDLNESNPESTAIETKTINPPGAAVRKSSVIPQ